METPKNGYAFRNKRTGEPAFAVSLGEWDSLDNYEEITEEEYRRLLKEKEKARNEIFAIGS